MKHHYELDPRGGAGAGAGTADIPATIAKSGSQAELSDRIRSLPAEIQYELFRIFNSRINPNINTPFDITLTDQGIRVKINPDSSALLQFRSPEKLFQLNDEYGLITLPGRMGSVFSHYLLHHVLAKEEYNLLLYWYNRQYYAHNPHVSPTEDILQFLRECQENHFPELRDTLTQRQDSLRKMGRHLPINFMQAPPAWEDVLKCRSGGVKSFLYFSSPQIKSDAEAHFKSKLTIQYVTKNGLSSDSLGDAFRAVLKSSAEVFTQRLSLEEGEPEEGSQAYYQQLHNNSKLAQARFKLQEDFHTFTKALSEEIFPIEVFSQGAIAKSRILGPQLALETDNPGLFKLFFQKASTPFERSKITHQYLAKHCGHLASLKNMTEEQLAPLATLAECLSKYSFNTSSNRPYARLFDEQLFLCESIKAVVTLYACFYYAQAETKNHAVLNELRKTLGLQLIPSVDKLIKTGNPSLAVLYYYLFDYIPGLYEDLQLTILKTENREVVVDKDIEETRRFLRDTYDRFAPDCVTNHAFWLSPERFTQRLMSLGNAPLREGSNALVETLLAIPAALRTSVIVLIPILECQASLNQFTCALFMLSLSSRLWTKFIASHFSNDIEQDYTFLDSFLALPYRDSYSNWYCEYALNNFKFSDEELPTFLSQSSEPMNPIQSHINERATALDRISHLPAMQAQGGITMWNLHQTLEFKTCLRNAPELVSDSFLMLYMAMSTGTLWPDSLEYTVEFTLLTELEDHLPNEFFELLPTSAFNTIPNGRFPLSRLDLCQQLIQRSPQNLRLFTLNTELAIWVCKQNPAWLAYQPNWESSTELTPLEAQQLATDLEDYFKKGGSVAPLMAHIARVLYKNRQLLILSLQYHPRIINYPGVFSSICTGDTANELVRLDRRCLYGVSNGGTGSLLGEDNNFERKNDISDLILEAFEEDPIDAARHMCVKVRDYNTLAKFIDEDPELLLWLSYENMATKTHFFQEAMQRQCAAPAMRKLEILQAIRCQERLESLTQEELPTFAKWWFLSLYHQTVYRHHIEYGHLNRVKAARPALLTSVLPWSCYADQDRLLSTLQTACEVVNVGRDWVIDLRDQKLPSWVQAFVDSVPSSIKEGKRDRDEPDPTVDKRPRSAASFFSADASATSRPDDRLPDAGPTP